MTADFKDLIAHVADGNALSEAEAEAAFNVMMSGEATPSHCLLYTSPSPRD